MAETIPVLQDDGQTIDNQKFDESIAAEVVQGMLPNTTPQLGAPTVPSGNGGKFLLRPLTPGGIPRPDEKK